jgi:hypothetical protein
VILQRIRWALGLSLFVSVATYLVIIAIYKEDLSRGFEDAIRAPMEASLKESLFDVGAGEDNSHKAILTIIDGFNQKLLDSLHETHWAPAFTKSISVESIDGLKRTGQDERPEYSYLEESVGLSILRGGKNRSISISINFQPNLLWFVGWLLLNTCVTLSFVWFMPLPMAGGQQALYNHLVAKNDPHKVAARIAGSINSETDFSPEDWEVFDFLDESNVEHELIVDFILRVKEAGSFSLAWFRLAHAIYTSTGAFPEDSLNKSFEVATAPDSIVVDPGSDEKLLIHGLPVKISSGPLGYYIFYLERKLDGDGWVTNPRTDTVNPDYGKQIEDIFERYGADRRSFANIDKKHGVNADMLRDMRSKISDAIKGRTTTGHDVFLPILEPYLFESRPSENNPGAQDVRIILDADKIILNG